MLSCLIPQAYEVSWTRLDDGIFNQYPPDGPTALPDPPDPDNSVGQTVPIPFTVPTNTAVLPSNQRRAYLLIQNNSTGQAGDVLPNLFVAYDGPVPPSSQQPLQLNKMIPPGSGIVLDRRCPNNAIYVRWGTFTNTSGNAFAGGVIEQGLLPVKTRVH